MSSNAEHQDMVHKLMAVTGIDDADFARDLLNGNGWHLGPIVNAHRMMIEDTGSSSRLKLLVYVALTYGGGGGNDEQMQQQQ